jgi:hypothetical protein
MMFAHTQQILMLATAALLTVLSPVTAATIPSLTGNPQTKLDSNQEDSLRETVIKTALRQRNNLPVTQAKDRRLGVQRTLRKSKVMFWFELVWSAA